MEPPVLLSTFLVEKKESRVFFSRGTVTWETVRHGRSSLSLRDVIAVRYGDRSRALSDEDNHKDCLRHTSFVIHYVARLGHNNSNDDDDHHQRHRHSTNNKWRHRTLLLEHTDHRQVASWVKTMHNCLADLDRPRRLLLFVNPVCGRRRGVAILERHVMPLLSLCGVHVVSMVTEHATHLRDVVMSRRLDDVDALVCVGGDGTFSDMLNALIIRSFRDAGLDPCDAKATPPSPNLKVGVIPGGSTDTMAYCLHGTVDVHTAVLHVILGQSRGLDVCSAHSHGALVSYFCSLLSYGFLGDVIRDSEGARWLGPRRYDYAGFKKLLANKGYEAEVTLLADPSDASQGPRCYDNCKRCLSQQQSEPAGWRTVRGRFLMVSAVNVCCACARSPLGMSPFSHVGDGCVDLVVVRHGSRWRALRALQALSRGGRGLLELPYVEVHRARELLVRVPGSPSAPPAGEGEEERGGPPTRLVEGGGVWNCDGEVRRGAQLRVRVHHQLLQVFSRGIPEGGEGGEPPSCVLCGLCK